MPYWPPSDAPIVVAAPQAQEDAVMPDRSADHTPAPQAVDVYTTDEVDAMLAERDARLDDHDARLAALEGAEPVPVPPDPPDPVPTPDGVDLIVDDVLVPRQVTQGQPATLGVVVTNQGDTATPTGAVVGVGFLLDDAVVGEQVAWVSTSAGLEPGASVQLDTATAPMTGGAWIPTAAAGAHELTAFVDDTNRIVEAGPGSEANNRLTVDVGIVEGEVAPAGTLFVPGSLWNTRKIPAGFAEGADGFLRGASWGLNAGTWGHPMTWSSAADPVHTFEMPNSWGWPAGTQRFPMRDDATPASGTDGHLCVIVDDGRMFDMWQLHKLGDRHWSCSAWAPHNWKTGNGWGQPPTGPSAGVTASGAPTGAGTITHAEVDAAVIPHALCFAASWNDSGGRNTCGSGLLFPAIYSDVNGGPGPLAEACLLLVQGDAPAGLNAAEHALFVAASTYGCYQVDKLDGQPMLYLSDAHDAGAFRGDKVTAIMRQARMVRTWA